MNASCALPGNFNETCALPVNWNSSCEAQCDLVKDYADACEGGGYVAYTALVICQTPGVRPWILVGCAAWLLFLFLSITVAADAFFSPNIAGIVTHLKISENIAGVTFMAFGNGAPDIFSALASVTGGDKPKAGLAVGALVGAGIFVTTVVVASMVLVRPFEVMRRPLMRDMGFYLLAVLFTIFVFLQSTLKLWETIGFLVIYAAFALVVIFGRVIRQRKREAKAKRVAKGVTQSLHVSTIAGQMNGNADLVNALANDSSKDDEPEWNYEPFIIGSGYFSTTSSAGALMPADSDGDVMTKLPHRTRFTAVFEDLLTAVFPVNEEEWRGNMPERIFAVIKAPITLILKLTNPEAGNQWSKVLALIQCFTCPLLAVVAAQETSLTIIDGGPPLWLVSLIVGIVPAILVLIFTSFHQEPRFFKPVSAYIGFLMAIFWIYALANEVVGVLQMVGVVSGLSHEVLGLTLLAWSNSLGDLVADIAVARRGFPKMGISAAFGGPLFNLLIGFGLPFTIALLKNKDPLVIVFSSVSKVLLGFLAISLISSLAMLPAQRFYARRPYGVYLLLLYFSFLVVVILTEVGVLFGGPGEES